jgi:hypothetical protein
MTGRALQALQALDPGVPRSEWVRLAMAARAEGVSLHDFTEWSAQAGNFKSSGDCAATWRSFSDGAVTGATLYAAAHAAGWRDGHPGRVIRRPLLVHPRRAVPPVARFDFAGVWAGAAPADAEHPYVVKKDGLADDLRVYTGPLRVAGRPLDGALLVPAYDGTGALQAWQAILPGSSKLNAPGARMAGGRFIVGAGLADSEQVFVCEGIGAAWSAHRATGSPAVCAFGFGNVAVVAADVHQQYPDVHVVVVADRGKESDCEAIARTVSGASVGLPAEWPAGADINDLHIRDGLDALAQLLAKPVEPARRFRVMTGADVAALPPVQWLVQGVLPTEGLACVFGAPGSGKSFIVLDLLAAVAAGRPWFGLRTMTAPTTLLSLEGAGGIAQRVQAFRSRHGEVPSDLRFVTQAFELLGGDDVDELAAAVRAAGGAGGVIVLDTLNAAAPGKEENSGADMGLLVQAAKRLQGLLGGLVLLVHHSGKDISKGMRGHSSLLAALDAAIEVLRDGSARRWRVVKSKDGQDGDEHPFRLDVVELGIDQHGEGITSCVVVPAEPAGDAVRRARLPAGGNQRVVFDALGEAFRGAGDFGQAGAPAGRPCIRVEAAVENCRGRLTCPPDRQGERARSAITGLVSRGVLVLRDGWLYLP